MGIVMLLILIMLNSLVRGNAQAMALQGSLDLTYAPKPTDPGVVTVALNAHEMEGVAGFQFAIAYDPESLSLEELQYDEQLFTEQQAQVYPEEGMIFYSLEVSQGSTEYQDLVVASMDFKIQQQVATTTISVLDVNVSFDNEMQEYYSVLPLNIQPVLPTSIEISPDEVWLDLENTTTFTYEILADPPNAVLPNLTWSISDPLVAELMEPGIIEAKSPGITQVTVTNDTYDFYDQSSIIVGSRVHLQWDESSWTQDSLANVPIDAYRIDPAMGEVYEMTAYTNQFGDAIFPLTDVGGYVFRIDANNVSSTIPAFTHLTPTTIELTQGNMTEQTTMTIRPLKLYASNNPFNIDDVMQYVRDWELYMQDFNGDDLIDQEDVRFLMKQIKPIMITE